jgi:hypothetical protein
MDKVLTPLPGVLPPRLRSKRIPSPEQNSENEQCKEGGGIDALLAQILQLDTAGILSSVRYS